jgi:hypothetical protein
MVNIPPPKMPRPKTPQKPPEKPSIFGSRDYVERSFLKKELKKEEYFLKLGIPQEKREKIGEMLGDPRLFGELIEKGEIGKVQSLINELKNPGSSSYSEVRDVVKNIRKEVGDFAAKKLADILKEKFGL